MSTTKGKLTTVIAAALVAALIVAAAADLYRRRRRRSSGGRWLCSGPREEKPQSGFKRVLADNSYSPFKHLKREGKEKEISLKVHPYEEDITFLLEHPPTQTEFITNRELPDTTESYTWIETKDQLELLARLLSKQKAFAVDTEQHSLRSFLGFTALMQISTEEEDFLLDTIALHDVMGILRHVFADPSICKVFHGADNDIIWLQRDFHIYVVNMFDTAKACDVLSKPQKSLAFLLDTYCGVLTDKTLQREDWRIRPLSTEMIAYARTDAHYLLYIADCLVSELIKENLACADDKFNFFIEASRRSNMVCMQLYTKESESLPGASAAASIFARNLGAQEYSSVKIPEIKDLIWRLCAWRDLMARIHDESLRYVLSDQAIVALAVKVPKNPSEIFDVIQKADLSMASTNVLPVLPASAPIVATHVNELCCLFQEVNADINDILKRHLQKHLNPSGCCPLSIYNYALLSEFSLKQTSTSFSKYNGGKSTAPLCKKASRELFVQKFSCKSPVYHNYKIYASDGRLLCYCDRKKLEWYIQRDLAKIVEDDPPAIMLLFEPKGRPEDEDNDFYVQSKKNICVGCGERNHYLRYRIIPSCYRMHFPEHLKSHRSHDIVLLCVDCHEIAHSAAEKYKRQIASEFDIPLFVRKIVDPGKRKGINLISSSDNGVEEAGVSPLQLRTAAMALLRHGSTMPSERHDELMQIVKLYFGGREISPEDLEMALLVGMSPHERRRLEKKKGWTFGHKGGSQDIVSANSTIQTVEYVKNYNDTCNSQESSKDVDVIDFDDGQMNTSVDDIDAGTLFMKDTCGVGSNKQSLDKEEEEECKRESDCISKYDNGNGDKLHEIGSFCPSRSDHVLSSKSAKKLSLLGHGPHGKQVVEHLLNNYGEDGICQFCQRWRQVFVEAVQPRFLPSGWDIKHSGKRDFGDYSVYKPAKRVPETVISRLD